MAHSPLSLCSLWAKKSQRSARTQPTPLRPTRKSVWGSQSNLLSLEPAFYQHPVTDNTKEDLQRDSDAYLPDFIGVGAPQDTVPAVGLEQSSLPDMQALGGATSCAVDGAQHEDQHSAGQPSDLVGGEQGSALGVPAGSNGGKGEGKEGQLTPDGQLVTLPNLLSQSPDSAKPDAKQAAVAANLRGGEDALAGPMQALISTVAKVGISPAAGMMLGSVATRSRDPSNAAAAQQPATLSSDLPTSEQAWGEAARPSDSLAPNADAGGKDGTGQGHSAQEINPAAGNEARLDSVPAATTSSTPLDVDLSQAVPPPSAVQVQMPSASLGQQALSGTKRSRRSLAPPREACELLTRQLVDCMKLTQNFQQFIIKCIMK